MYIGIPSLLMLVLVAAQDKPAANPPAGKPAETDYEAELNDKLGKGITPEKNAAVLIWQALGPAPEGGRGIPAEFFRRLGIPEPPKQGAYFVGLNEYAREHLKIDPNQFPTIWDDQTQASKWPWAAKDYPHIAGWLKANEHPLAVVIEATKRPEYYSPLVAPRAEGERGMILGALLPGVQKCRELATALTARAMLRVAEGKTDDAWQDLLACHRLGRFVTRSGTFIETLVGIAIGQVAHNATLAYLDRAKPTPKQLAANAKDLRDLPPRRPMADVIDTGERYLGLDALQHIRRGGGELLKADELKGLEMIDWDTALRIINASYDKMAVAMRVPDRAAREKAFDQLEKDLDAQVKEAKKNEDLLKKLPQAGDVGKIVAQKISGVLMGLLTPSVRKVQSAYDRGEQTDRNLRVAFAMAAYHADNGKYPAKLDDLAPKYLAAVPDDVFSGKPLIYKPTEKGYLFYSVGVNGKDDGGRWTDDNPPGDDPRVRMPMPEPKKK